MASARLVVSLVGIFAISTLAQPASRIWGGEEAGKNSFAYVASVRLDGAHICGGSIVGSRSILTAAHCVVENSNTVSSNRLAVRVGSTNQFSGGKLYYVSGVSVHPNYSGVQNDIAVLELELSLEWTDRVAMIDIATSSTDEPAVSASVKVAGWGDQSSDVSSHKLHSMTFSIATEEVCTDAFSGKDISTICLAHDLKKGSCIGDAGNGAVYKNKLIGVSSFIVGACGSRYPDIFSNVVHYAPWIQNVLV
ncbi:serine protease SP24D [Calliphora vicina]|uniref:serine protease SP24D n=1 Tax=Calliphora vicina TaxID=7373 RepID=UPI00325A82C6